MITLLGALLSLGCGAEKTAENNTSDRYQEGYDEGYGEGFSTGYDSGRQDGFEEGSQQGYDSGYQAGSEDGYDEGVNDSTPEAAWDLYATGDYAGACSSFFHQSSQNGIDADTAVGLGWCHLRQSQVLLASSWFEMAVAIDATSHDGWAGLGSAALLLHDFDLVSHAVDQTLMLNPSYSCSFEDIDAESLQVAQILSLLFTQDTAGASIFLSDIDPTHGIVPLDSTSWVVDSASYSSFQRAVLAKLHSIGGI